MLLALRNIDLPLKVRRHKRRHNIKENLKHLGRSTDEWPDEDIMFTADWCNLLPRKILGYKTPDDLFENELDKIYAV